MSPSHFRINPVALSSAFAVVVMVFAASAAAQQLEEGEYIDQTGEDEEENEEGEDGEDGPYNSFQEMSVTRVQPSDIPDFRPGLPEGSDSNIGLDQLPQRLTEDQLRELSYRVASSTVEIVAVVVPPEPYRPTELVYRGHAVWVSPNLEGDEPVLVATADWLEDADRIYAAGSTVGQQLSESGVDLGSPEPSPLEDVSADQTEFLEQNSDNLVPLEVEEANPLLNLARLGGADDTPIATPDTGLVLHDMDTSLPGAIFGFSPGIGNTALPVGYRDSSQLEEAYSFYFTVDFGAILGAPVVDEEGRLIGMTALRHPARPDETLTIPPGAIHSFLDTGRAHGAEDDDS